VARVPVRIVSSGTNVSGGLGHRSLGPGDALVLESDIGVANISGGVVPMTAAEYEAAGGLATAFTLEDSSGYLLLESGDY
jgi:hypothetical protein